jgi:hypothetical protein
VQQSRFVPTYIYSDPHDATPHTVVADSYELSSEDDDDVYVFVNVTWFDGDASYRADRLLVLAVGGVEVVAD